MASVDLEFTMRQVRVHEAKTHLSRLLRHAVAGVARLLAIEERRPVFGIDEGRFVVSDDFDAPLDEDLLQALEERG